MNHERVQQLKKSIVNMDSKIESTEGVLKRSFTNIKMVDFKSNRQMAGHDTDDWVSVMKTEIKFMEDCFS